MGNENSVGISGGYQNAAVSGTVNISQKICSIVNNSSSYDKIFDVSYDYKANAFDFSSSGERSIALFTETTQYATCEWTTPVDGYGTYLKINAKFGVASSKTGWGTWRPFYDYSSGNSASYYLSFSR